MSKSLFLASLAAADPIVRQVELSQLANETPCTQWNLHELLNHMAGELAWAPELLAGKTVAEVGDSLSGDLIDKHPQEAWAKYSRDAEAATQAATPEAIVHLSYGDFTTQYYLDEVACDIFIHTWDAAKAIGTEFHIPEQIATQIYKISRPKIAGMQRAGMVAKPKVATINGTAEAKLLAIYGRA